MNNYLAIDDLRNFADRYITVRTFDEAKAILPTMVWEEVIFDHDLGDSEPNHTGYDLLTWMLEQNIRPKTVFLVTSNPIGRERMGAALIHAGYYQRTPFVFSLF